MGFLRKFGRQVRAFLVYAQATIWSLWKRVGEWNNSVHRSLHTKFPTLAKIIGGCLRFFYGASTHPAFAVLLALLLVGFVISGAITIIMSVSVFFAWLITVLWLAHSEPVKAMNILPRCSWF